MKKLTTSKTLSVGETELITVMAGTKTVYTFTPIKKAAITLNIEIMEEIKE